MDSQNLKQHICCWLKTQHQADADDCLMAIVDYLFAVRDFEPDPSALELSLTALSHLARQTWWCCDCSSVNPTCGEVDAFCPKCGGIRHLPPRLSFPVWTAYVMAAKSLFPSDWFTRLSNWSQTNHLLAPSALDGSAHEGVAAYCSNAAIDAQGDTSPTPKQLIYIDNMRVCNNGETIATNWIALELPDFDTFKAL